MTPDMSHEDNNITDNSNIENSMEIARVSVKIPVFWKNNPALWFSQVEANFRNANIRSDQIMFDYIIGNIDCDQLAQISDLVTNPPTTKKYETLKQRLIEVYADSQIKRVKQLLVDLDLGDNHPSHLLRQMRGLASGRITDEFLRILWLQRMPSNVQQILSASPEPDLENLAKLADHIMEYSVPGVNSINTADKSNNDVCIDKQECSKNLIDTISKLSIEVSKLRESLNRDSKGRSHIRSRSRSPTKRHSNDNSQTTDTLCWYHRTFGQNAHKCHPPCNYLQGNDQSHT